MDISFKIFLIEIKKVGVTVLPIRENSKKCRIYAGLRGNTFGNTQVTYINFDVTFRGNMYGKNKTRTDTKNNAVPPGGSSSFASYSRKHRRY